MAYQVNIIDSLEELEQCELFHIDHYQWVEGHQPKAFGRMGLLRDFGFVVTMTAMEANPLTTYTEDNSPVYFDSALEAFFDFTPEREPAYYVNFEMNSNGAMLNEFGTAGNRKRVEVPGPWKGSCQASRREDSWSVLLQIPMEYICHIFEIEPRKAGDSFTCNFFKTSSSKACEHYASYAPIISEKPNFHLPEFFEKAIIVDRP